MTGRSKFLHTIVSSATIVLLSHLQVGIRWLFNANQELDFQAYDTLGNLCLIHIIIKPTGTDSFCGKTNCVNISVAVSGCVINGHSDIVEQEIVS